MSQVFNVTCPKCQSLVNLDEALSVQFKTELENNLKVKIEAESTTKLKLLEDELAHKEKKLKEAENAELELRKQKNELEEQKRTFELEKLRQIDQERELIRQKTTQEFLDSQRLKDKENEKKIDDLRRALQDAQRKADQGSQQLQGEVLELDLEESLTRAFPTDSITPVGKGIRGADIKQTVKTPKGTVCGVILWETKRTKAWSDEWITKLKSDLRAEKANSGAIISTTVPRGLECGMGYYEGIWIATFPLFLALAEIMRQRLIDIAREHYLAQNQNKKEKGEILYEYVTGHEFRQQIEAIIESYQETITLVARERATYEKLWKTREAQAQKILLSSSRLVGSIQGITGSALHTIKGLDMMELNDGQTIES